MNKEFKLPKSVAIAIPAYDGKVPVETANSLAGAVALLRENGVQVYLLSERGNGIITLVRNSLAKKFIEETESTKLLFIDNDIVFESEDVLRILALSSKYPIVGATYPCKKEDPVTFFVQLIDTKLNEDGLLPVKGFGAGFVVIDRSVFEEMEPTTEQYYKDGKWFLRFFQEAVVNNEFRGEDIYFLRRWYDEFKGQVMLDPWINLKHVGLKYFDYKFSDWLKGVK